MPCRVQHLVAHARARAKSTRHRRARRRNAFTIFTSLHGCTPDTWRSLSRLPMWVSEGAEYSLAASCNSKMVAVRAVRSVFIRSVFRSNAAATCTSHMCNGTYRCCKARQAQTYAATASSSSSFASGALAVLRRAVALRTRPAPSTAAKAAASARAHMEPRNHDRSTTCFVSLPQEATDIGQHRCLSCLCRVLIPSVRWLEVQ